MPTVNAASPREGFEGARALVAALRRDGRVSAEVDAVFRVPFTLLNILMAVRKRSQYGVRSHLTPFRLTV